MAVRPRISPLDAAKLSMLVIEARTSKQRPDGHPWSQEDLAWELGLVLGRDVNRHHAAWLESSPPRPLGKSLHRELWRATVEVLELDRDQVNRLCGGV